MKKDLHEIVQDYQRAEGNLVSLLQVIQDNEGYLSQESIRYCSERLNIPESKFYGVATFYAQFHLKPRGRNIVTVCCGTACHVKGSEGFTDRIKREFNIPLDEETSSDLACTVERVSCVGACSIAPVMIVNKKVHGKVTLNKLKKEMDHLRESVTN